MQLRYLILLFVMFYGANSNAQITISGSLVDAQKNPILYANLLILNTADSSLIQGFVVNEGTFSVAVSKADVLLKVKAVGFNDKYIHVTQSITLGEIELSGNELNEVVVIGQMLPFESIGGNMKINVSNNVFAVCHSLEEVLTKSPGVLISQTEISVVGRGEAVIYVDGQETTREAAKAIPVSLIESIEIVKNPDASYDAKGKAVILIQLKDLGIEGMQSQIYADYTNAFYHLGFFDFTTILNKGKWSGNFAANTNIGSTGTLRESEFNVNTDNESYIANTDYSEKVRLTNVTNIAAGLKYMIGDRQSISAQYNGNYSSYDLWIDTEVAQDFQDSMLHITTVDTAVSIWKKNLFSMNYNWVTDSLGSHLFAGINMNILDETYEDFIREEGVRNSIGYNSTTLSTGGSFNNILIGQIDYLKLFKSEANLKIGTKYTRAHTRSEYALDTYTQNEFIEGIRNNFLYQEEVFGGYVNWNGIWKKGHYQLGARIENTQLRAEEGQIGDTFIDSSYFSVFPNFNFTTLLGNWTISEQFNSKISRPSYSEFTPYIFYLSSFAAVYGNPLIQPSFVYTFEHKFSNDNLGFSLGLGTNQTNNPLRFVTLQGDSSITTNILQTVNLDKMEEYYVEVSQALSKKYIYSYLMVNMTYTLLEDANFDIQRQFNNPKIYVYGYNRFPIKNWFNIEVFGSFTGPFSDGLRTMKAQGDLGFGISKQLNQWSFQITANDIFQWARPQQEMIIGNNSYVSSATLDTRFYRFSLRYSFGKLKQPNYYHQNINQDEMQRVE
ncbi:MAG: outer membrane beta-barrel protein [Crocinitomicaceae bacterium]|nr:outer membrane beta-barrel protein [Crocinitomicaceae bacterium]